jgi:hypothetical protein
VVFKFQKLSGVSGAFRIKRQSRVLYILNLRFLDRTNVAAVVVVVVVVVVVSPCGDRGKE